jgi:hypothetical protein
VQVDFICVGGNKCGTTWLSEMLRQHPGLNVSANKEPRFFTDRWENGWDWYARNWAAGSGAKGEFSTAYLHRPESIRRIAEHYPDVKILVLLREPLERAVSHFRHLLRELETDDYNAFLVDKPTVIRSSVYGEKVRLIERLFPRERTKILLFDQIKQQPAQTLQQVFRFLEVDPDFRPRGFDQVVGKGFVPRSRRLEALRAGTYRFLQSKEWYGIIVFLKKAGIADWIRRINAAKTDRPGLREALLPYVPEFIADVESLRTSPLIEEKDVLDQWLERLRGAR